MARKKLTKKQRRRRTKILSSIVVLIFVFVLGVLFGDSSYSLTSIYNQWTDSISNWIQSFNRPSAERNVSSAEIHVLDVEQGSSTLFQSSDGTNILVDTGRHDDEEQSIVSYLDEHVGIGNEIDLLIFTHNHADHIGNGDLVFDYFEVEEVWMNGIDAASATYENVLDAVIASEAEYFEPKAGEVREVGPFYIEVLHPQAREQTDDQNEESIVTRISVNDLSIMTSGDAGFDVEDKIVQHNNNLYSEIMILGHHGSRESTGRTWLNAVNPEISVYSAGANNSYGHPHNELLYRVEDEGVPVVGTDINGTVSFYIDEDGSYEMQTEYE